MTTRQPALGLVVSPRTRRLVRGIHVIPGRRGGWEVRTLGPKRIRRVFDSKLEALSCALRLQGDLGTDVIVHQGGQGYRKITILTKEEPPEDLPEPS